MRACRASCGARAGFDVPDFLAAGPRDVLVPSAGRETAREVLLEADMAPTTGERRAPRPLLLAAVSRSAEARHRAGRLARLPGRLSGNEL